MTESAAAPDRPPPAGLVDIHAHLLPGIDDGPRDLEGALGMAKAAVDAGIATVVATPHLRSDFPGVHIEELAHRCRDLRAELDRAGIALRVVEGAEVSLPWALQADEETLRLATFGQAGRDILIETPSNASMLPRLIEPLLQRGLRITIAHPERSSTFRSRPELLAELHNKGVLAQINAGALVASSHSPSRRLVERLCRDGLAQIIASDGHRGGGSRPVEVLAAGVEAASAVVGRDRARWMAAAAPAAIVEGRALPEPPPVEHIHVVRRRWRLWGR